MATLNIVNIFAKDIIGLSRFYREAFGFKEIRKYRSPIFRLLDSGKAALGFNAHAAYELLELKAHKKTAGIKVFINIEARSKREVDERVAKALKRARGSSRHLTCRITTFIRRYYSRLKVTSFA